MGLREGSSRSSSVATTGSRPTNSGIRPYFQEVLRLDLAENFARLAILRRQHLGAEADGGRPPARRDDLLEPVEAPPHTNRMSVVSTCRNSCCGCLRPPCGGTDAMVPSIILSKACCTPSPETSRVIEGLSDLRLILSISSI